MKNDKTTKELRSFSVFALQVADGDAHKEASAELAKLLTALYEDSQTRMDVSKGKLVVSFSLALDEKGQCEIAYDVKVTPPPKKRAKGLMWHDPNADALVAEHPRQARLFDEERAPARAVDESRAPAVPT